MRTIRMLATTLTGAAALAVLVSSPSSADVAVTKVSTTVNIPCAATSVPQGADWYLPAGTPKGLIWVQHGFSRSKNNVADLAGKYAAKGYVAFAPTLPTVNILGCTLQNLGNNTDFLANVAALFGNASNSSGQLATSFAAAKNAAGRPSLTLPTKLLFSGHSAGGEAVAYVAEKVRTNHPAVFANLKGLILLDPVKSNSGTNLATGISGLDATALDIKTISAPDGTCNNSGTGTDTVQTLHQTFVGTRLLSGSHVDAEGASADAIGNLACGASDSANVTILQTLAVNWAVDDLEGTTTAGYYPGGTYYNSQIAAGRIETLAGTP
ncbi:hypothetical protein GCM10022221_68830 [Actinocorallia aurea]